MYVTVNSGLAQQITETANYLSELEAAGNRGRNDRERFYPVLDLLDRYAVAIHASKVPVTSFLGENNEPGPRFQAGNGTTVTVALEKAVAFLRDKEATGVPTNSLSMYEFKRTTEVLILLKELHFGVLVSIRKAAENDLRVMVSEDVERFLSTAELIRSWTTRAGSTEDEASSDDR